MKPSAVLVESSAVLEWLLDQPRAPDVHWALASAPRLVASRLLLVEAARALARQPHAMAGEARRRLDGLLQGLDLVPLDAALDAHVGRVFPHEPVRTLDAVHLATALLLRPAAPGLAVLALDERVRRNALALGFVVVP